MPLRITTVHDLVRGRARPSQFTVLVVVMVTVMVYMLMYEVFSGFAEPLRQHVQTLFVSGSIQVTWLALVHRRYSCAALDDMNAAKMPRCMAASRLLIHSLLAY